MRFPAMTHLGAVTDNTAAKVADVLTALQTATGKTLTHCWGKGSSSEHATGRAVDFMVFNDRAAGDWIADYLIRDRVRFGLGWIIWRQRIWNSSRDGFDASGAPRWRAMADRGSTTQNHMDHPHVYFTSDAFNSTAVPTPGRHRTVTVKRGDTLLAIAVALGVSLAALRAANPAITNPDVITPGQVITVPDSAPVVPGPVAPAPVPAPAPAPAPSPTVITPPKVTVSASPLRQGTRSATVKAYQIRLRDWLAKRIGWPAVNRINPHKATGYYGPETVALTRKAYAVLEAQQPGRQWGAPGGYPVPGPALLRVLGLR